MELDLKILKLREVNEKLQNLDRKKNERDFKIINPEGNHALCAGLTIKRPISQLRVMLELELLKI